LVAADLKVLFTILFRYHHRIRCKKGVWIKLTSKSKTFRNATQLQVERWTDKHFIAFQSLIWIKNLYKYWHENIENEVILIRYWRLVVEISPEKLYEHSTLRLAVLLNMKLVTLIPMGISLTMTLLCLESSRKSTYIFLLIFYANFYTINLSSLIIARAFSQLHIHEHLSPTTLNRPCVYIETLRTTKKLFV
jgi:hypothetical protein